MGFSKIPVLIDLTRRGVLIGQCKEVVERLEKLHFRSSDFPPLLAEAAALYDTTLTVAGLQGKVFATVNLAKPYAASARLFTRLECDPELERFGTDLLRSAEEMSRVKPVEAFHYQINDRDYFSEQRLAELDHAVYGRFSWLSDNENEYREEWAIALFENVAEQLELIKLFENMPDPEKTVVDQALHRAWIEHKETWLRDTVSALPNYETRRDDTAELRALMMERDPEFMPRTSLQFDSDLFDLLLEKGLRRCGSSNLKMRRVDGKIIYGAESPPYEHQVRFKDADWIWLIKTTGAPQIYYQDAEKPFLEDAIRRVPEDYKSTLFSQQERANAEERNRKALERRNRRTLASREGRVIEKNPTNAPSSFVMETIRGWLKRT
ncbi:hypothetical protein [Marivita sp.]|uniref:hypothetical protein n=1 Tax=Marivita sp. TaxID=2003365 RepID=UPI003F6BAF9F